MRRKEVLEMNMIPVISSDLNAVGYENGILYIRFNSGGLYCYSGVPLNVFNSLLSAGSKGRYFHAFIKGRYPHRRIG